MIEAQEEPAQSDSDRDLERIIDILDEAMMSSDPRVEECLRRLMVTIALVRPEGERRSLRYQGPLATLFNDMNNLRQRVAQLERNIRPYPNMGDGGGAVGEGADDEIKRFYSEWLKRNQAEKQASQQITALPQGPNWKNPLNRAG